MLKQFIILVALTFFQVYQLVLAYEIKGSLQFHQYQQIKLYSYNGLGSEIQDSAVVDSLGHFKLSYNVQQIGMGYFKASDNSILPIILDQNSFVLNGRHLQEKATLRFENSPENQSYYDYLVANEQREAVLSGWKYLLKQYEGMELFKGDQETIRYIENQVNQTITSDESFINKMPISSYTRYILPIQNLIQSVAVTAKYYPEEIPNKLKQFRSIDYTSQRLYNSGLLNDVLDAHYWLIENSGRSLDSVFLEMNHSTDYLLESLQNDEKILNITTDYLFDLLEKHSLFKASEYLALKLLTQNSCTLDKNLANQLEIYRAMKVGKHAKDLLLTGKLLRNGNEVSKEMRLSSIATDYKLIMFGASWCPKCTEELPKAQTLYEKWLSKGVEVVFIALDNDESEYLDFVKTFSFISYCDFKEWETAAAKDYYVFSTPTLFLLDSDNKIVLRPNSIKQVDAWVDFYIK